MSLLDTPENHIFNSENCSIPTRYCDPLQGLGDAVLEEKFYRIDSVLFAEPLNIIYKEKKAVSRHQEETMELNNVTVTKRLGKRKKLFVHLHDDSDLTCPLQNCKKTFSTSVFLKTHIRKVHYSEKRFTCEVCGAGFSANYLLKRHSAVHGEKKMQCPVCLKMLSLRTKLSAHLRTHAEDNGRRKRKNNVGTGKRNAK